MKRIISTVCIILFSVNSLISPAQGISKQSVGLQFNPYVDEFLFTNTFFKPVYAFRYSWGIKDHLTFGPELSGFNVKARSTDYRFGSLNFGGFVRYSFLPASRIRPFIEISPYYTFHYWRNYPADAYPDVEINGSQSLFSGYVAPGVTLYSKSKKASLDLFYKFSDKGFINGKRSVLSYRLNINF